MDTGERSRARTPSEHERSTVPGDRHLALALEACPAGILMVDAESTVLLANGEALRMFGYEREELLGRSMECLVPPRHRRSHREHTAHFAEDRQTRRMGAGRDFFGLRKDGSEFPVEIGLNPAHTDAGLVVTCSVVDVTARKRDEQRMEGFVRALERSNKTLEQLAQVVSHDVRAPLRAIVATAEWLQEDLAQRVDDPESRKNLHLLNQRATHLAVLVEGILRYSRAGLGNGEVGPVDSEAVMREVIESLQAPPGVHLAVDTPLPVIPFDTTQLGQVFQNLVGNALVHLGKATGEVRVGAEKEVDGWRFTVRDTGVGIPEADFERIFELFRTAGAEPRRAGSSGLGLAIVKRIVESHGGSVQVRSTLGEGTEMSFTVPCEPARVPRGDGGEGPTGA